MWGKLVEQETEDSCNIWGTSTCKQLKSRPENPNDVPDLNSYIPYIIYVYSVYIYTYVSIYICLRVSRIYLVDVCAHECLNNKLGKYFNIHHAIKISRCLAQQPQQPQQPQQQLLGCLI